MRHLLIGTLLVALGASAPALAGAPDYCPARGEGDAPVKVYAIGSSTMGSVLGPMLKHLLKAEGVSLNRWGKASSGLARPDFHDWPAVVPGLMHKHKPDIVIVSMGSNDFQSIWHKKKKWIAFEDKRWAKIYGKRVDRMLKAAGGKDKQRLVVWEGPYAFKGKKAQKRAPVVSRIMKERVDAYIQAGGRAVFIDAYAATTDAKGRPLSRARLEGGKKRVGIRGHDGIHLTADAVRALLAAPIMDAILPCLHPEAQADEGGETLEAAPADKETTASGD